jgi:hypothetical protein
MTLHWQSQQQQQQQYQFFQQIELQGGPILSGRRRCRFGCRYGASDWETSQLQDTPLVQNHDFPGRQARVKAVLAQAGVLAYSSV